MATQEGEKSTGKRMFSIKAMHITHRSLENHSFNQTPQNMTSRCALLTIVFQPFISKEHSFEQQ